MTKEHKKEDWPIKKFPGETRYQLLFGDDAFRNEETMTTCPACRGTGKTQLEAVGPKDNKGFSKTSMYRFVACKHCKGAGMVTASEAKKISSGVYKKEG